MPITKKKCLYCHEVFDSTGAANRHCSPEHRKLWKLGRHMLNGVEVPINNEIVTPIIELQDHIEDSRPKNIITELPTIPKQFLTKRKGTELFVLAQQTQSIDTLRYMIGNAAIEIDTAIDIIKEVTDENKQLKKQIEDFEAPQPKSALSGITDIMSNNDFMQNAIQLIGILKQGGNAPAMPNQIAGMPQDQNSQYIMNVISQGDVQFNAAIAVIVHSCLNNPDKLNKLLEIAQNGGE